MSTKDQINYPYADSRGSIGYMPASNPYMMAAKAFALEKSLDKTMPTATVLVKKGKIIGRGANGSTYHETHGCERVRLHMPTGKGYELCEGCSPQNHSEPKAIEDALKSGGDPQGAEAYLWGHWWACESCWNALIQSGVARLYLLEESEHLFNKASPQNIVGKQFA